MKKQVLFTLCLTAATAAVMTGCARKGEIQASQQEATLMPPEDALPDGSDEGVTIQPEEATPPPPPPAEVKPQPGPQSKPAAPAPEQPEIYTVTKGDSVSALAVRFGVRQPDILALNPELRKNPNNLRIGQKLKFPAGTDVSKKAKPRDKGPAPAADATLYVVKSGDVLDTISRRYGVKVADIKKANHLKSDNIWVGQKLIIPGAKKAPTDRPGKEKGAKPQPKPQPKPEPKPQPAPAPVVEEQQGEEALPPPPSADTEPPALLPPPPGVDTTSEPMGTYTTKEGDDLTSVSLMWSVPLQDLRAANGISDAAENALPAGTVLKIPQPR